MVYIELTDLGEDYIKSIFPNHQKRIEEIFSILSEEELNNLMELLKKVGYHSQKICKEKTL
jgi:MarR family 2-MHQ and catechol resistance regulon transcriptional repressor